MPDAAPQRGSRTVKEVAKRSRDHKLEADEFQQRNEPRGAIQSQMEFLFRSLSDESWAIDIFCKISTGRREKADLIASINF
jgi:hypothetical protein